MRGAQERLDARLRRIRIEIDTQPIAGLSVLARGNGADHGAAYGDAFALGKLAIAAGSRAGAVEAEMAVGGAGILGDLHEAAIEDGRIDIADGRIREKADRGRAGPGHDAAGLARDTTDHGRVIDGGEADIRGDGKRRRYPARHPPSRRNR